MYLGYLGNSFVEKVISLGMEEAQLPAKELRGKEWSLSVLLLKVRTSFLGANLSDSLGASISRRTYLILIAQWLLAHGLVAHGQGSSTSPRRKINFLNLFAM